MTGATSEDKVQELMGLAWRLANEHATLGPFRAQKAAALESALRAVVEDAMRYRWLRHYFDDIWIEAHDVIRVKALGLSGDSADRLDTAIDHARKGEKEGG